MLIALYITVFADVATCAHVSNVHKSCNVIAENVLYAELQYRMLYRHATDKGEYIYIWDFSFGSDHLL